MSSRENSLANRESVMDLVRPTLARGRYDAGRSIRQRPSLQVSRPPDQIWGQYNNYRIDDVVLSAIIHVAVLGLILSGALVSHQIVQKVESRQTVTLIAPSPDSYALPTSKQVVSGGGGGGDHDPLPAPKGHPPKVALQQITPPAIIVRNEKPRLAAEPTAVVPSQVHLAENHMPNIGLPRDRLCPQLHPPMVSDLAAGSARGLEVASGLGMGPELGPEAEAVSAAEFTR